MLQLRKTSNQRTASQTPNDGSGAMIQMNILGDNANPNTMTNNPLQLPQQFDDALNPIDLEWINKQWIQRIVRACALCSFISICANTPESFKNNRMLMHFTYVVDMICTLVFTIEMIAKIKIRGLFRGDSAYIFDRWSQFDGIMVIFHIISVVLQTFELFGRKNLYWSLFRCPRPLILIRVIRAFLRFRLPKNRINSILQRSSSQIYNVTIFFLFFMALYAILGVQFFGELTSHCVKTGTNASNVTINDLMIPDTYCSPDGGNSGYQCPPGMECLRVEINRGDRGFNGFDEILTSLFTVYEAASQEGWVFLMYRATDSLPSWRAFFYFISMIFFLAWLVKNVFIAVIIETFAEIRVQFQQMWGVRGKEANIEHTQIFERTDSGLKLVTVDNNKSKGLAPEILQKIMKSSLFNMCMLILVLVNALITATIKHTHKEKIDSERKQYYKYIEAVFTIIFDLECIFKILCFGFKNYWKRSIYKFEFILALGNTARHIPPLYQTEFTYFQVLRVVRLIKSSPMLEDFVNKIFGPGKKLGTLIIFTMCLLIITSCVSMQLFCFLGSSEYIKFDTFDQAFMSQFAILTSEGWTETMYETMKAARENSQYQLYAYFMPIYFIFSHMFCSLAFMTMFQVLTQKGWLEIMHSTMRQSKSFSPLVAVYFISYHLFVTLIVLSLFVAVILDNLELDEDVKKIKQLKMREQSAETQQTLPWRLRIFEKFPNHPQMVSLKRVSNDFEVPKIRESFMRHFLGDDFDMIDENAAAGGATTTPGPATTPSAANRDDDAGVERKALKSSLKRPKSSMSNPTAFPSIAENSVFVNPTTSAASGEGSSGAANNKADPNAASLDTYKRRKMVTPNAHAAQLRVLNNVRMQRACRYSIKKVAINNIINISNNQRLFTSAGEPIVGLNDGMGGTGGGGGGLQQKNVVILQRPGGNTNQLMNKNRAAGVMPGFGGGGLAAGGQNGDIDFKIFQYKKMQAELKRNQLEDELKENHPYFDKPLFTIGRESNFRKFCKTIVEARYERRTNLNSKDQSTSGNVMMKDHYKQFYKFLGLVTYLDWIMIAMTIQSCVGMMFETPNRRLVESLWLIILEYIFVISMSIEMILKVCAYGLFFTPNAMVKDFGGVLDLFIYFVSLLFLILLPKEVVANSGAQILMLLRCLRPLRIFTLVPHMRKVIYELCRGFKEILLVSILLVVLIFIFANYGIQMFGGKLARCNDVKITDKRLCTGIYRRSLFVSKIKLPKRHNSTPGIWVPRVWANPYNFNFDTIGNSMLALFEVLSLEGWLEVRDVIIERMSPRHSIFVHVFVFIGTLIGLTLFVGVVITNYSENKGTALLTVDQRRWLDLKGRIKLAQPLHIPPRPENSSFRAFMFDITQHKFFKRFSAFLVLLNCALLSVPWKVDGFLTKPFATVSAIFTVLFLLEAVMKACALGPLGYWQSRRNRFDLFVTALGIIWIILHFISFGKHDLEETSNSFGFVVIVLRFFTIAGKHATLKMLMLTIFVSFYKSFFIIVGMFLLMLVYAFAGVILFGCVKAGHDLGRHANFRSSPNAIVLLMRIVTGEDWNKIMHDCMIAPPACTKAKNYWESDCGNFPASILYFCSFYVIITYIVLNLLVAIIMENFSLFYSNEEDALLSYSDIRHFQNVWNIVDTNRKGVIPCRRVKFLLRLLRGRLEVDLEKDRLLFKHMCYEIERLNNGGDVTFHDVLNMLSYRSVDIRKSLKLEELLAREELEYQIEEEVAKQTIRNWLDRCLRKMRERGRTNIIKTLNKQNDIAIFKEQMKQLRTTPSSPFGAATVAVATAAASIGATTATTGQASIMSQLTNTIAGAPQTKLLGEQSQQFSFGGGGGGGFLSTGGALEPVASVSDLSKSGKSSSNLAEATSPDGKENLHRVHSTSSNKIDDANVESGVISAAKSKLKKRNTMDKHVQMQNEEKIRKRNLLILESKSMTNDVKSWWQTTIDNFEL